MSRLAAWRQLLRFSAGSGSALLLTGCWAGKVATAPVKLAANTVVAVGETAGAVVSTTGRMAASVARAVGSVGSGGIDAAARLAEAGMVTFVDAGTGVIVRVPWQPGLTLAAAGESARIPLARRVIEIVRGGRLIQAAAPDPAALEPLASGDVVRLDG